MKIFYCGICGFEGSRRMLRKHLKEEHLIRKGITNTGSEKKMKVRREWKTKEFK